MINQKVLENSSSQLESRYYIDEIDSHSIKIGANWIIEWYRKPVNEDSYGGAFWTKMQSNRDLHSIGSYPCSIGSYLSSIRSYFHSIRSYFHSTGSYLSSIRSYFNYFVASYMTLVYSSVVFHIYPYLRGNSIPSDRNYRSAVVTIWSAVKRGRLNLDLVLLWRHTTYDYMTCNWKSSRTWSHADDVDSVYISRHILSVP